MDVYEEHKKRISEILKIYNKSVQRLKDMDVDEIYLIDKFKRIDQDIVRLKNTVCQLENCIENDTFEEEYKEDTMCDNIQKSLLPLALLQCMEKST